MDLVHTHQSDISVPLSQSNSIFQTQTNFQIWTTITNETYEEIFKQASLNLIKNQHFFEKKQNSNEFLKILFQLISNYLFKIHNGVIMLCETNKCILKKLIAQNDSTNQNNNYCGFRFLYLDQKYEFFTQSQEVFLEWSDHLHKTTIQQNINSRYKIDKKIERPVLNDYEVSYYCISVKTGMFHYMQALEKEKMDYVSTQKLIFHLKTLRSLEFSGVIKISEVFENHIFVFIIYDLDIFIDLKLKADELNKLDEMSQSIIFYKLIQNLNLIHSSNIIVRNIRADNLILNNNMEKLAEPFFIYFYDASNFELNQQQIQQLPNYLIGYVAPETITNNSWSFQSDIYSLGIVFYTIVFGKNPFQAKKEEEILLKNEKGEIDFSTDKLARKITLSQLDLLKSMLRKDPQQRITLHNALNHHWFVSNRTKHGDQNGNNYYDNKLSTIQEFSERIEKQSSSHFTTLRNNSLHFTHASLHTGKRTFPRQQSVTYTNTNQDDNEEDSIQESIEYFKKFILRPSKYRHDQIQNSD